MGKARSISDEEIALIRAMLNGGYNNTTIQAYFTRPDRVVNSARITGIKQNSYGKDIPACSKEELDHFLELFRIRGSSDTTLPEKQYLAIKRNAKFQKGKWWLTGGEGLLLEFKEGFNIRRFGPALRATAAFANADGGTILFGVKDDGEIVGLKSPDFFTIDISEFSQVISSALTPFPKFHRGRIDIGGIAIGALYVEVAESPPIISTKNDDPLREGTIYFRYPGESKAIRHAELVALLERRDKLQRQRIASLVEQIAEVGATNTVVLNPQTGKAADSAGKIDIEPEALRNLRFIREGEFSEVSGAPAIRIVGEATEGDLGYASGPRHKVSITDLDILSDFIWQTEVDSPLDYIAALISIQRERLPVFYYLQKAGLSRIDALEAVTKIKTRHTRKKGRLLQRIQAPRMKAMNTGPTLAPYREMLLQGQPIDFSMEINRKYAARALQTIRGGEVEPNVMFASLQSAWQFFSAQETVDWFDDFCHAAAHLDELQFSELNR